MVQAREMGAKFALLLSAAAAAAECPIAADTNIVFSEATGVGGASKIWVRDLLWWWKQADSAIKYQGLSEQDVQACEMANYPSLRLYINPGGNAYNQLSALNANGTKNIKDFVQRPAEKGHAAYAGFCAGAYLAAHDYVWETFYEGPGYFNFKTDPPLSIFPHTVEGSLVDISDDQFGDQMGHKYRLVNVSNGHQMLYFGGSSMGFNAVADYTDPKSPAYDPEVKGLIYYQDFYGHLTYNLPAAWTYKNMFLSSIHAEADNCTVVHGDAETADCLPPGSIPTETILRNRAWLATHLNAVAGTSFEIPPVPKAPSFDTRRPHTGYPQPACGADTGAGAGAGMGRTLFCDGFDSAAGEVAAGLWQWQRNQTKCFFPQPWNTTFIPEWNLDASTHTRVTYGPAAQGNGYAVVVPKSTALVPAAITSKPMSTAASSSYTLSYFYKGQSSVNGSASSEQPVKGGAGEGEAATPTCISALKKECPTMQGKAADCHACVYEPAHEAYISKAGCNMTGNPPADIASYCRPGPGPQPVPKAAGFYVEYTADAGRTFKPLFNSR